MTTNVPLIVTIHKDAAGAWPDMNAELTIGAELVSVACIPGGMNDGSTSIAMRCELNDGRTAIVQTSLALLRGIVKAFAEENAGDEATFEPLLPGEIPS